MKKWLIPLLLVFTLGACGNDEEMAVEETDRVVPDGVTEVYADY